MTDHLPQEDLPSPNTAAGASSLDEACAARRTADGRLFARLIAARDLRGEMALLGIAERELHRLFKRHFTSDATPPRIPALPATLPSPAHQHFVDMLTALLLKHASQSVNEDDARCLAAIIAHACLRPDHLWRDLGLSGRDDVTSMLERFFPTLVTRNTTNLRWKKFLALELALATGTEPGPAPGCPGCEDFGYCFPRAI